jgi:hypothetical protein
MDTTDDALARIDTTVAHPARRYNYWLGGKDHFAADRASADAISAAMPGVRLMALENRMFMGRAVRFLAERGIRQFLDIGTGIPAPNNTHEVAQAVDPATRVVYVDNDHSKSGCAHTNITVRLLCMTRTGLPIPAVYGSQQWIASSGKPHPGY